MNPVLFATWVLLAAAPEPDFELAPISVEASPGWFRTASASDASLRSNYPGGSGFARLGSVSWRWLVWTPATLGFGVGHGSGRPTGFFSFMTEPGVRLLHHQRHQLRVNFGFGLGRHVYAFGSGPRASDMGAAVSPSIRYHYALHRRFHVGGGFRALAVVPGERSPGTLFSFFVDLAWIHPTQSSQKDAGQAPSTFELELIAVELMPWFVVGSSFGGGAGGLPGLGLVRLGTAKWRWVYWCPGIMGGGLAFAGGWFIGFYATEVGVQVIRKNGHSLRVGLGAGLGFFQEAFSTHSTDPGLRALFLPTVRYAYQVTDHFFVGTGLRAMGAPIVRGAPTALVGLFFDVGWSVMP